MVALPSEEASCVVYTTKQIRLSMTVYKYQQWRQQGQGQHLRDSSLQGASPPTVAMAKQSRVGFAQNRVTPSSFSGLEIMMVFLKFSFFLPLVDFMDHFPEICQIVGSSMFYSKHSMPPNSFPPKNLCSISTLTLLSPLVIGFWKYLGFGQIKIRTAQGRFRKRTRLGSD